MKVNGVDISKLGNGMYKLDDGGLERKEFIGSEINELDFISKDKSGVEERVTPTEMKKILNALKKVDKTFIWRNVKDGWGYPMITTKINKRNVDVCVNMVDENKLIIYTDNISYNILVNEFRQFMNSIRFGLVK